MKREQREQQLKAKTAILVITLDGLQADRLEKAAEYKKCDVSQLVGELIDGQLPSWYTKEQLKRSRRR